MHLTQILTPSPYRAVADRIRYKLHFIRKMLGQRPPLRAFQSELGTLNGLVTWLKLLWCQHGEIRIRVPGAIAPIVCRANTSDVWIMEEIFIDKEYAFDETLKPELILDIGANVGYTSVYYAIRYPDAHIIAVEPEASNAALLLRNIQAYPNVTCVETGVWHRKARLEVIARGGGTKKKASFQVRESGDDSAPMAVTIPELLNNSGCTKIDILKIDVEGAEQELFSADTSWLQSVNCLVIELHDRFRPGCREAVFTAVEPYDFTPVESGLNVFFTRSVDT